MSSSSYTDRLAATAFFGVLFLFFFQLLADFVESIYAFGLLQTGIPLELIMVLLLFSPVVLLFLRSDPPFLLAFILAKLVLMSRVIEVMLDPRGRMLVSGIGVACFLLLMPLILWDMGRKQEREAVAEMGTGLLISLALSVLFRTIGSGQDILTVGWWQVIGWVFAILGGAASVYLSVVEESKSVVPEPLFIPSVHRRRFRLVSLSIGLMAVLVLLYFLFTSPQVFSRWSALDYRLILPILMVILTLWAWIILMRNQILKRLPPLLVLLWNAVFVLTLALAIYLYQVAFPADPSAFPLAAPTLSWGHHIPLLLTLVLFPIILLDFSLLSDEIIHVFPSVKSLGIGFSLASLFLLVMIFAHVFTTTYDYIPVVGPFFRDKFWLIHLFAGLVLFLAMLLAYRRMGELAWLQLPDRIAWILIGSIAGVAVIAVLVALLVNANPASASAQGERLKVLTYNIQQGYSADGWKNYAGQLALMRELDADIIGLQESDTARIAGGNSDVVRYMADHLDMHSYYGPSTVTGTFGIALLSKYPIADPQTHFLYSEGEQVAVIEAEVTAGDQSYSVFVTHLGNGGPIIQQEQFLELVEGKENIIAMGDFNFRPTEEPYALTTSKLDDSWTLQWPDWVDDEGQNPQGQKIDHIFVTPGTRVLDAEFVDDPASDHPAVMATLG